MLKDPQTFSTSYLIKQIPTAIVFINKQFKIVHVSDKWVEMFSLDGINVSGSDLFKIYPHLSAKWKSVLRDCFKGKPNPMGLQQSFNEYKKERWHEWSSSPWYDTNENLIGAIIKIEDVTDAIQNQFLVEKKETLLRQQSEISKIGRWEYDMIENTLKWCS
ncbi:MAG: PAS domain S-box protein, partial [Maribacter sp.]